MIGYQFFKVFGGLKNNSYQAHRKNAETSAGFMRLFSPWKETESIILLHFFFFTDSLMSFFVPYKGQNNPYYIDDGKQKH